MRFPGSQRSARGWIAGGLLLCAALGVYASTSAPAPSDRSIRRFDAQRMADLELRMWQAYYAKERVRLFALLVTTLHEQYHYSWATAASEGFHLARAAAAFGDARSGYERVLPDLEKGYRTAKEWLHAEFDPPAVARAELAWWVARRNPGQNSPAQVGGLMADSYALLYEVPREQVLRAATLRAEAAALRDAQAANPDWPTIRRLLDESYRDLHQALAGASRSASDGS